MKNISVAITMIFLAVSVQAQVKVASMQGDGYQHLASVTNVKDANSNASGLYASVISLMGGDGMNPTRMALSLTTGDHTSKVYMLETFLSSVERITFLAKDVIVINYTQDDFDNTTDLNQISVKKSLKITVQRDSKGQMTDEILMEDFSK